MHHVYVSKLNALTMLQLSNLEVQESCSDGKLAHLRSPHPSCYCHLKSILSCCKWLALEAKACHKF